jgi:hypothetical protein
MFREFVLASLIGSGLLTAAAKAAEPAYRYTRIDYPGATSTVAIGINSAGDIVGSYVDAFGTHGYFWRHNGDPIPINVRDSDAGGHVVYTDARGINPGGEIVGMYYLAGEDRSIAGHGYLRQREGTFVRVHHPGSLNEWLQRILPDGSILGCHHDLDTMMSMYGAVFSRGVWSSLPVAMSMTNGAMPDLRLQVGHMYDMTVTPPRWRGFLRQDGAVMAFDFPGATLTQAWDMSPQGAVVGNYTDGRGGHGFLLENGQFSSIEVEGASATAARGISPRGDIVGWYRDANGRQHGFFRTRISGTDH